MANDWSAQQGNEYVQAQFDAQIALLRGIKEAVEAGRPESAAAARDLAEALRNLRK